MNFLQVIFPNNVIRTQHIIAKTINSLLTNEKGDDYLQNVARFQQKGLPIVTSVNNSIDHNFFEEVYISLNILS